MTTTQYWYTWSGEDPYNFHWDINVLWMSFLHLLFWVILLAPFVVSFVILMTSYIPDEKRGIK